MKLNLTIEDKQVSLHYTDQIGRGYYTCFDESEVSLNCRTLSIKFDPHQPGNVLQRIVSIRGRVTIITEGLIKPSMQHLIFPTASQSDLRDFLADVRPEFRAVVLPFLGE
jgi:hypothetical protein